VIALGVVTLGACLLYPGLGILLALIFTPMALYLLRKPGAEPVSGPRAALGVMATIGATVVVVVAAFVTFAFTTCVVTASSAAVLEETQPRSGGDRIVWALGIGIVAGLVLAGLVVYQLARTFLRVRS
jgi:hypothetical protein